MSAEIIPLYRSCVVIECGWLHEIMPSGQRGPGRFEIWLDWYDEDGGRAGGVWNGTSYREAREAAAEWGLPIVDNVRGRM